MTDPCLLVCIVTTLLSTGSDDDGEDDCGFRARRLSVSYVHTDSPALRQQRLRGKTKH